MVRRSPLVCQYLENISHTALKKYQSILFEHLRHRNGIYALYRKGKIQYVGLASNLRGRLNAHLKNHNANRWDRFSVYLTVGDRHLRELESLVLRILAPVGNRQKGKFHRRCENLRPVLTRKLRQAQRAELDSLFGRVARKLAGTPRPIRENGKAAAPLAKYVRGPMVIRRVYKGKLYRARVRRDGMIRMGGKLYKSPSQAGNAVRGKATNGWHFWQYERAAGDWVLLHYLRQQSRGTRRAV